MSYDFNLRDPVTGEELESAVPHQIRGGTYCLGGTNKLHLNVTYNYAKVFNFRQLDQMTGATSVPILKDGIAKLGNDVDDDYWNPTEGNVKRALCGLLALAQMRPGGVWRIT